MKTVISETSSVVSRKVCASQLVRDTFESPNIWLEPRLLGSLRVWATWKWCRYPVWVSWKHSWQWALRSLWISWQWLELDIQEGWDILCVTRYHFCVILCERVCQIRNQCLHLRPCQHACIPVCAWCLLGSAWIVACALLNKTCHICLWAIVLSSNFQSP